MLEQWAEDRDAEVCKKSGHVQTVYGWVPSQVVLKVIESHGGMVSVERPDLIPCPDHRSGKNHINYNRGYCIADQTTEFLTLDATAGRAGEQYSATLRGENFYTLALTRSNILYGRLHTRT